MVYNGFERKITDIVEKGNTYNVWEQHSKECRARRNYAETYGLSIDKVPVQTIIDSERGVEGWAAVVVTRNAKDAKTLTKPKAKPKASGVTPEKQLKSLIASYEQGHLEHKRIIADSEAKPDDFSWAKAGLEINYRPLRQALSSHETTCSQALKAGSPY